MADKKEREDADGVTDDMDRKYISRVNIMMIGLRLIETAESLSNELYTLVAQQNRVKEALAGREGSIIASVNDAKDENDKPKYSNESARKAETALRLADDAIAVSMRDEITTQDIDIAMRRERIAAIHKGIEMRRAFLQGS